MRLLLLIVVMSTSSASTSAWSHGGGLNRQGCHNQRATGGYHCHRSSYTPSPPKTRAEPIDRNSSKPKTSRPPSNSNPPIQRTVSPLQADLKEIPLSATPTVLDAQKRASHSAVIFNSRVEEAQSYLSYLGFDVGPADGLVGVRTTAAIRAYQRTRSLAITGKVSEKLLNHMASTIERERNKRSKILRNNSTEHLIERAQFYLSVSGYYTGKNNGVADIELEHAIMRYQNENRISVDGQLTPDLLAKIKSTVLK